MTSIPCLVVLAAFALAQDGKDAPKLDESLKDARGKVADAKKAERLAPAQQAEKLVELMKLMDGQTRDDVKGAGFNEALQARYLSQTGGLRKRAESLQKAEDTPENEKAVAELGEDYYVYTGVPALI